MRGCDQLQSGTNSLSDAGTAGALRFFEEFGRDLYRNLARWFHGFIVPYRIPVSNMVRIQARQLLFGRRG
jgi:hypothetical protein